MSSHKPRKRFGQNFLHDPAIIERIVRAIAPDVTDNLVEIGPGEGAITLPILRKAGRLQVVELDRDLIEPLARKGRDIGELRIHNADALAFDFSMLAGNRPLRLVGNLPYNISTPLLFHLTQFCDRIQDMHFMLQKEVVDRITAQPGCKSRGRLSVMLQVRFETRELFTIGPGAFRPAPRVDSAFIRLVPHASPVATIRDPVLFEQVVRQAFAQRRKTLRNSLAGLLDAAAIAACDIDPGARPESLDVAAFAELANRVATEPHSS